jgi:hypothetical protein
MIVKLKKMIKKPPDDHHFYQNLSQGKNYYVVEISNKSYRVFDDAKEPILYPKYLFITVDSILPSGWSYCGSEEGEYFIGPSQLNKIGFYEDYFDGNIEAIDLFSDIFSQMVKELEGM